MVVAVVTPRSPIAELNKRTGAIELTREGFRFLDNLNQSLTDIASALIIDSIQNGITDQAPSSNAVFDALALKLSIANAAATYLPITTAAATYLTITAATATYQPLDADLTSWAAITRASGFDTFAAAGTLPVANGGTNGTTINAAARSLTLGYVLAQSAVGLSHTGDTTETVLVTVAIPAATLGANGQVVVETVWTMTSSANSKTAKIYFGASGAGTGGTVLLNAAFTTTASLHDMRGVFNRNATNSQIGMSGTGLNTGSWASAGGTPPTPAVDTTAATELAISGTLANGGETITLEWYRVIVYPKA